MGTTFKYIADGALPPCVDGECQHCGRTDQPVYPYVGEILDPARAADPELAREEPEVEELCAGCILGGNVRKFDTEVREVLATIESLAADKARAIEEYHRTPRVRFLQHEAWPMCCGEFAEYVGNHPPPGSAYDDYECWEPQDALVARFKLANFYPLEKLPVMHTMALFRCPHCAKRYWVFQYSGLSWPGPLAGGGAP